MQLARPGDADACTTAWLRSGLAALAVAALHSGAMLYWHLARGGPRPLYAILALVAGSAAILALEPHRPAPALRSPLLVWTWAYLLVTSAWGVWRPAYGEEIAQTIVDRFRSTAFLFAMVIVFDHPRARTLGRYGVLAVAAISSIVNVAEALGLIAFEDTVRRTAGRAAGLYINPNGAALAIVFGLAAGLTALRRRWRVPALLLAGCGVAATFSRGGLACLALLVLVLLWRREVPLWTTVAAAALLVVVVSGPVLRGLLESSGTLNRDTLARLAMTADDSGRLGLAAQAWQLFLESPWVGHGIATERAVRVSHNMYLTLAGQHGILGLLVFPALVFAFSFRNRAALELAAVLLAAGLISHNLLENEPALLCVALAASLRPAPSRAGGAPALAAPAAGPPLREEMGA
jgi:O-antigen ligase